MTSSKMAAILRKSYEFISILWKILNIYNIKANAAISVTKPRQFRIIWTINLYFFNLAGTTQLTINNSYTDLTWMNASCPVHVLVYSRGSLFRAILRKKCIRERKIVRFLINFTLCYIYNCLSRIFLCRIYFESRFKRRH